MAGTFPGVSGVQQIDLSGRPMVGGQLSVFLGGTNTLALTYQDIGLAILSSNPLTADATGRIPLFFVADGTYKVRLVDKFGDISNGGFEYPQCPSIGASASGGGGSAVDPTTIMGTGDIKAQLLSGTISGWVRLNGRTVGNAVSGASERASADTQALFLYLWTNFTDAQCPVSGGRSGSGLTDFNAAKTITLPDMRGRSIVGLDDMGAAAANRLSGAVFVAGSTSITPYGVGGEAAHTLTTAELASHSHHLTDPGHQHNILGVQAAAGGSGTGTAAPTHTGAFTGVTSPATIGFTDTDATGNSNPHNTMPPFALATWYMKL